MSSINSYMNELYKEMSGATAEEACDKCEKCGNLFKLLLRHYVRNVEKRVVYETSSR